MAIQNVQEKFIFTLGEAFAAENQLLRGYEQMLGQATDDRLRGGIQAHAEQTREQIGNLQQIFDAVGQQPQEQPNETASGMVADGQRCVAEAGNPEIRDCLIAEAGMKIEHFEMACYLGLVTGARLLGQTEAVGLLQYNLQQEEQMAQQLQELVPQLIERALSAEGMPMDQGTGQEASQTA